MSEKNETVEAQATEIVVEDSIPETENEKFITVNRAVAYHKMQRAGGLVRTKIAYFVAGAVAAVGTLVVVSAVKNNEDSIIPEMETID